MNRTARLTGALFLITFITSIPALLLYHSVLKNHSYITGSGADTSALLGVSLELILIVANIGTAVVLYPVLKHQSERLALGFVAARIMECFFIGVGILSVLAVVTLRQDLAGGASESATLHIVGRSLVGIKDWTFLLGPGFIVGIGNGLILGYLMYRSELVPRRMAILGLIGGPLVCASGLAVLGGAIDQGGAAQFIATIPEFLWELSLGVYLLAKGFKSSAQTSAHTRSTRADAGPSIPVVTPA